MPVGSSAIRFAAVADAQHAHGLLFPFKADPVSSDAKPVFGRFDALQPFHISGAGGGEAFHRLFNAAGSTFIEIRHLVQRGLGPFDIHPLQAQPAHGFVVRNAFAAVLPK